MYEQKAGRETILDKEKESLLKVRFDAAGLPLSWQPGRGSLPVNITYDRYGSFILIGSDVLLNWASFWFVCLQKTEKNATFVILLI